MTDFVQLSCHCVQNLDECNELGRFYVNFVREEIEKGELDSKCWNREVKRKVAM